MANIIAFTESGSGIGFGHFTRVSAILEAAAELGHSVRLFLDHRGEGEWPPTKVPITRLSWLDDPDAALGELDEDCHVLIDSYLADDTFYDQLVDGKNPPLVLDDYQRLAYSGCRVVVPNPYGDGFSFPQALEDIGGSEMVILRPTFLAEERRVKPPKDLKHVMITLGGMASPEDFRHVVDVLREFDPRLSIHVVAGNDANFLAIRDLEEDSDIRVFGCLDAGEMLERYRQSDLVVCNCGQTLHEVSFVGTAVIGIRTGEDQRANQSYYLKHDVLSEMIVFDSKFADSFRLALEACQARLDRLRVRDISMGLVDGSGVRRILAWWLGSGGEQPSLRKTGPRDALLYYGWVNDPAVRSMSVSRERIPLDNHLTWFHLKLEDPDAVLLVFEQSGCPIGQIRFEVEDAIARIDYSISSSFRGRGLGRELLRSGIEALSSIWPSPLELLGIVHSGNGASAKLFRQMGFREAEKEIDGQSYLSFTRSLEVLGSSRHD